MKADFTDHELLVLADGISQLISAEIRKRADHKWTPEILEETGSEIEMLTELHTKLVGLIK